MIERRNSLYTRAAFKPGSDKTYLAADGTARLDAIEGSRQLGEAVDRYLRRHHSHPALNAPSNLVRNGNHEPR